MSNHAGLFLCPKMCVHFYVVCPGVGSQVGPLCVQDSWQGSKGRQPFCRWGWTYVWTYTLCVHPPSGLWLSRWTSATARELESAAYFFMEKAGAENTPPLTNGYCIPDRSPLGLHPSGHPAKHKDSLKFSACFLWSLRDWLNGEMIARHLHFSLCLSSVSPAGRAGELRSNS